MQPNSSDSIQFLRRRSLAVRIIGTVLREKIFIDEAIARVIMEGDGSKPLRQREHRSWLMECVSGTLRTYGRLEWVLDQVGADKKITGWFRRVLCLAIYQILFQTRVSSNTVIAETLTLIQTKEGFKRKNFAYALLQGVLRNQDKWNSKDCPRRLETLEEKAQWASLPPWLYRMLSLDYRDQRDQGEKWLQEFAWSSLQRPRQWLRLHPEFPASDKKDLGSVGPLDTCVEWTQGGSIAEVPSFEKGQFFVQDVSNQVLIAEAIEAIGSPLRVLDLCAAPGGKAMGLAWSGCQVVATDIDTSRMQRLRENVQRTQASVKVIEWSEVTQEPPFDGVWVDAPCTGSGILRRHPEIRWLRSESDFQNLVRVQKEVLRKGWEWVKPGGWLVYSVCSVVKEECEGVLRDSGLVGNLSKKWNFFPQDSFNGDGYQAFLIQK